MQTNVFFSTEFKRILTDIDREAPFLEGVRHPSPSQLEALYDVFREREEQLHSIASLKTSTYPTEENARVTPLYEVLISNIWENWIGQDEGPSYLPAISYAILYGIRELVELLLQTKEKIDFSVPGDLDITPLHAIAMANTSLGEAYNREVTRAVVRRLETHPEDVVFWGQVNDDDMDFISLAAHHQLLSTLWPEVKEVPYFADQVEPIALRGEVWAWDWEALGEVEQQRFSIESEDVMRYPLVSRSTSRLWKLSQQRRPCLEALRACVDDGAEVMFCGMERRDKEGNVMEGAPLEVQPEENFPTPILIDALFYGRAEIVEVLLWTPHIIDFTIGDALGDTPLHGAVSGGREWKPDAVVETLLDLIVDRLEFGPPTLTDDESVGSELEGEIAQRQKDVLEGRRHAVWDHANWSQLCHSDTSVVSYAALCGHLSTFVRVLYQERRVPYFLAHRPPEVGSPLPITEEVYPEDWSQLSVTEQKWFELKKGFVPQENNDW